MTPGGASLATGQAVGPARPRAVLDTSSLYRAGLRRELQIFAADGIFEAIWSPWIIAELNRVLAWDWIARTDCDRSPQNRRECSRSAKAMMALLLPTFTVVTPVPPYPPAWETLGDPDDLPIWAAAKVSGATYVVSENRHDYPPARVDGRYIHEGIEYLSGRAFLAMLRGRDTTG